MTKFAIEVNKYCSIKKFSNVEVKVKKMASKAVRLWLGVKIIIDDDELKASGLDA